MNARLTYAEADAKVRETAHRLANTHLPFDQRWDLAREHEANLDARDNAPDRPADAIRPIRSVRSTSA